MKILLADDDRTIHISLSKPFTAKGFEVINAYDGQEALDMALKKPLVDCSRTILLRSYRSKGGRYEHDMNIKIHPETDFSAMES